MEPRTETLLRDAAIASEANELRLSAALGAESVHAELAVTGHAQVLAVLAPGALPDKGALAEPPMSAAPSRTRRGMRAMTAVVETLQIDDAQGIADLAQYFTSPPTAQDSALAFASVEPEVPRVRLYANLGVLFGTVDQSGLAGLRSDPRVSEVQPAPPVSLIRPKETNAAAKRSGLSWGLECLDIQPLWDAGYTGEGILIGHLDTGVDGSHPALNGAIAAFAEFDLLGKPVPQPTIRDSGTHGTHTAGTIAGRAVGNTQFGVAPGARLASAIVIEDGNVVARILAGMDWAVGLRVRILNMSLGLRGYNPAFLTITRILRDKGVLPVFAVGNEGPATSRSPGNYAEALSVGACDENQAMGYFSGSQRFVRENDPLVPDLVAPGVKVLSCVPGGKYATMSGTSMATPHISGLAALLMQASPSATPDQIESAIFKSCRVPAGMNPELGNRGVPNAVRALAILTGSPGVLTGKPTVKKARPAKRKTRKRTAAAKSRAKRAKPKTKRSVATRRVPKAKKGTKRGDRARR